MPEISQPELDTLRRTSALLDKMWNHPKKGLAFKRDVKELVPDANIPELDTIDTVSKPFEEKLARHEEESKALRDRLDKMETERKNAKEEGDLEKTLIEVKSKFKFTEEGMDKVIARMKEKSNPDAEAAAAWVAAQEKKTKPLSASNLMPSPLNLYGSKTEDENYAALNKDPIGWAENEMVNILNEFAQAAE